MPAVDISVPVTRVSFDLSDDLLKMVDGYREKCAPHMSRKAIVSEALSEYLSARASREAVNIMFYIDEFRKSMSKVES